MNQETDELQEIKAFKCKNGHTLGYVIRNRENIVNLIVLRDNKRIDGNGPIPEVDIVWIITGWATVRCGECGSIRDWVPGEYSLDRLLEHYRNRR